MKTIIIGLGNPILTDDGVGVKVAYEVEKILTDQGRTDITVTEASVGGLRLMELMIGYDRAIIVDAIMHLNGHAPGTIFRMDLDDLRQISPTQHSASAHDTSLVTALDAAASMGMPIPEDVLIIAVEVENVMDFGETPTPAVAAVIPTVTQMVLDEIQTTETY